MENDFSSKRLAVKGANVIGHSNNKQLTELTTGLIWPVSAGDGTNVITGGC